MITDAIFDMILGFAITLFDMIPLMDVPISSGTMGVINSFLDIVKTVLYFFPWKSVLPILAIIVTLQAFRIAMALFRFLLKFFPGLG